MRTFIVVLVASLVPAGMWMAGCRQDNRQAAFPKTSEMKALAKADAKAGTADAPPVIPPAPIDRDILNLPENTVMARVDAVNDRARQIAKPNPPEGLFTLPDNQDHFAMAAPAPDYQAAPAALQPIPSAREFWSRPAAPVAQRRRMEVPEDIRAMAAPAAVDPIMAPPAPFLAPVPASPAALPVENVPGLFDGSPVSMRSGGPPEAPARFDGLSSHEGGALGAAPSSSNEGPLRLDLQGLLGGRATESMALSPASPAINPAIVVRSIPGDYEPLPEPIPLEEYNRTLARRQDAAAPASFAAMTSSAMMASPPPLPSLDAAPARPAASTVRPRERIRSVDPAAIMVPAFLPRAGEDIPAAKSAKSMTPLPAPDDVRQALAPLPDISRAAKKPVTAAAPAAVSGPDLAAARTTLPPFEDADFFKTDFWDVKSQGMREFDAARPAPVTAVKETAVKETVRPAVRPPAKKSVPARRPAEVLGGRTAPAPAKAPTAKKSGGDAVDKDTASSAVIQSLAEEETKTVPQKVKLTPVRRTKELSAIDTAAEAPPVRF